MPWKRPTIVEIRNRALADLNADSAGADAALRRSSNLVLSTTIAGVAHGLYGHQHYLARQINVITAEDVYLERHGRPYGIVRKPAAYASGSLSLTGISGKVVPAGTRWQGAGGDYVSRADATLVDGVAVVTVDAEVAGTAANLPAGDTVSIVVPIDGLVAMATVAAGGIAGGAEREDDESLRERILYRKRYPAMGGSQFDYVSWAREVPGVTRAWCFPRHAGPNSVGVAFVLDGQADITPNQAKIDEVSAYIESHPDPVTGRTIGRPVTADVTVFPLTLVPLNPTLVLTPNTAAMRAEVITQLSAFYRAKAAPGGKLYLSQLQAAVSAAPGLVDRQIVAPVADQIYQPTELPVLGVPVWQ